MADGAVDTGNNAWVGLAFTHFAAETGEACYARVAREILVTLSQVTTYICVCIYIYIYIYINICMYMHVYIYVYIYVYMYIYLSIYLSIIHIYLYVYLCLYVLMGSES